MASDQIARLEIIKLEKLQHLDKLKTELNQLNMAHLTNARKLKNNCIF